MRGTSQMKDKAIKSTREAKPKQPKFQGWLTTDEDEIERRRHRGATDTCNIKALDPDHPIFGAFLLTSGSGEDYHIEIRSLTEQRNSCNCPDHQVNRLGTCKHVEAVLHHLREKKKRLYQRAEQSGLNRLEVYLDHRHQDVRLLLPEAGGLDEATALITPLFASSKRLLNDPLHALPAINRLLAKTPDNIRQQIRVSRQLEPWREKRAQRAKERKAHASYEADLVAGKRSIHFLRLPLYEYQQQGMRHLAFTGRALLADEMGLGKTVQSIAAAELLSQLHGVKRVLVISPASLKGEWEDQIEKFSGQPSLIIAGPRAKRLQQYRQDARYYLANYEQIRPDYAEINKILAPDLIILDEAQRIKNWQTKTATSVKYLNSRFAFVLTGTPIENRIDEIYSIVQFLDPSLFGPLFRFNRDFYQLDERGNAIGYRNLDKLHRRLRPVMLRRRKHEVEGELPDRTVNNYFVPMDAEQRVRHDEYQYEVAKLASIARKRPLKKEERERLQMCLSCMRMICDSPYILDQNYRESPKLEELKMILNERLEGDEHKIIIFSEWVRMLDLVREYLHEKKVDHAWHVGSTPLPERREEVRRFMNDPSCRIFLSSDSGSVGLNLQQADTVINLDLPWNPAKLEQRIARAWRKHQTRPVQVINLISEDSIEHRMLDLLDQKRSLADSVLDGTGEESSMALPSSRSKLVDTINELTLDNEQVSTAQPSKPQPSAEEALQQDVLARWQGQLERLELHNNQGQKTLFAVCDEAVVNPQMQQDLATHIAENFPNNPPQLEIIDRTTYDTIQRLIKAGILGMGAAPEKKLHGNAAAEQDQATQRRKLLAKAKKQIAKTERQQRMATLLAEGGFSREALAPLKEAVEQCLHALASIYHYSSKKQVPQSFIQSPLLPDGWLNEEAVAMVAALRNKDVEMAEKEAADLLHQSKAFFERLNTKIE